MFPAAKPLVVLIVNVNVQTLPQTAAVQDEIVNPVAAVASVDTVVVVVASSLICVAPANRCCA